MSKIKYVYWIATGLLCLGYLAGAGLYTFNHGMVADMFPKLGYPVYLTYLLPVVKVLGPVAILSRMSIALSDLAYAGMFFHLPLAFSAHVTSGEPGWQPAVVMFVLLLVSFFTQNAVRKGVSPHAGTSWGVA
jgi:DoxX-like family